VNLRDITFNDLKAVLELLCEGFPRRSPAYWQVALNQMSTRALVPGYPRYGYLLESDDRPQGVLLLLTTTIDAVVRSNLSSWYVRKPYRGSAIHLFQHATREKGGVYLNLSPSDKVLPIVQAFGFKPYTNGTLLFTPRLLLGSHNSDVRVLGSCQENGCEGFFLEDNLGTMKVLYRIKKLKSMVPAARLVYGDPKRLSAAGPAVSRALIRRGLPIAMADAPLGFEPPRGIVLMPKREIRYSKRGAPPAVGDLRETEIAVFGP
jgi:hypothetical protein